MTVIHRQAYLLYGAQLHMREVDSRKLLAAFELKHHLCFQNAQSPRNYRDWIERKFQQTMMGVPKIGLAWKIKALEILQQLNREQDERILRGNFAIDLAFKYNSLIRFLVEIKTEGERLSKENIYEYVQDKILDRLQNGFYLSRYKGGDFRFFLDQEIEYRILDGIRREQKRVNMETSNLEVCARTAEAPMELKNSSLFQELQKQFSFFVKTLKKEDRTTFYLTLLVCHASEEHLVHLYKWFPEHPNAVARLFTEVESLYRDGSKQKQYESIAKFLNEIGQAKQADTIRKQLEKYKKNIWQILFKKTIKKENEVEKTRLEVFEWLVDAFFAESL